MIMTSILSLLFQKPLPPPAHISQAYLRHICLFYQPFRGFSCFLYSYFYSFALNRNGWWYLRDGKVQFGFTGIADGMVNGENASWYVREGRVNLEYSGSVTLNNRAYSIKNGKVAG